MGFWKEFFMPKTAASEEFVADAREFVDAAKENTEIIQEIAGRIQDLRRQYFEAGYNWGRGERALEEAWEHATGEKW